MLVFIWVLPIWLEKFYLKTDGWEVLSTFFFCTRNSFIAKHNEGTGRGCNPVANRVLWRDRLHYKQSSHEEGHEWLCVQMLRFFGIGYCSPILATAMSDLIPAFTFILAIVFRFLLLLSFVTFVFSWRHWNISKSMWLKISAMNPC